MRTEREVESPVIARNGLDKVVALLSSRAARDTRGKLSGYKEMAELIAASSQGDEVLVKRD